MPILNANSRTQYKKGKSSAFGGSEEKYKPSPGRVEEGREQGTLVG